jgi:hypothetical protein
MEQLHRTAWLNGIPTLYHYEKFNPAYLATILRDQIIHCSNPNNLNDPWDCKPVFDPHALDDPEVLEREMAWRTPHPDKHLWEKKMREDTNFRVEFMIGASPPMQAMLAERRIYCLTPKPANVLMWSHYADNHRGICLEFSVADNLLFRTAAEVVYREEYPRWVPCDINDKPGLVMELILTKSRDWSYEEEYRLVSVQASALTNFQQLHGDFFRLPKGALKAVIMGCEADHKNIGSFIREYAPDLPIKKAVRSPNLYTLSIVDYLPS